MDRSFWLEFSFSRRAAVALRFANEQLILLSCPDQFYEVKSIERPNQTRLEVSPLAERAVIQPHAWRY